MMAGANVRQQCSRGKPIGVLMSGYRQDKECLGDDLAQGKLSGVSSSTRTPRDL